MTLGIVSGSRDVQTVVISLHPKTCSCLYRKARTLVARITVCPV